MKKILYKKINLLEIILLLSPIVDILTAISQRIFNNDISLGLIIRSFLLFFMTMFTLFKSNYKYKKITIIYILTFLLYSAMFIINTYITKGQIYILSETKELIKAFYFPMCIICILNYLETNKKTVDLKILFCVILEYIICLFIPCVLKIGYDSYAEDKIGTIGWFFSANEISAIYSILIVLVIFSYKYIKNVAIYLGVIVFSLYTIMQIGTKMPAITSIIAILGYIIIKFLQYLRNKDKVLKKSLYIGIVDIVIFAILFLNSPVLKNFDIYKNYLITTREEVKLVDSNAIVEDNNGAESENIMINDEANEIVDETEDIDDESLTREEVATIIHSGRLETKDEIKSVFYNSSHISKILGLGKINSEEYYLTEIDYYDILFNFGYLGLIIYFLPIIIIIGIILKKLFIKGIHSIIYDDYKCVYSIIIINGLICAIAGHTFVAPAVSIYISIAIIQLYREFEKTEGTYINYEDYDIGSPFGVWWNRKVHK